MNVYKYMLGRDRERKKERLRETDRHTCRHKDRTTQSDGNNRQAQTKNRFSERLIERQTDIETYLPVFGSTVFLGYPSPSLFPLRTRGWYSSEYIDSFTLA